MMPLSSYVKTEKFYEKTNVTDFAKNVTNQILRITETLKTRIELPEIKTLCNLSKNPLT
jgi:hypothetical protein